MELSFNLWRAQQDEKAKILLLHGMGGTGALWRPIAASLEECYSVMAPDQRGHGKSQIPNFPGTRNEVRYTPLEYGRDVIDTLDRSEFHPVWGVGHSMGVRTLCAAAHLRPEWFRGLVLIDLGFSGVAGGGLGENLATFLKILPMNFASRAEARTFMNENCPDPSIAQYLMAVSMPTPEGGVTFPFDRSALIQTIHAARDASVRTWVRELGEKGMPILVLRGQKSGVWSREEFEMERQTLSSLPSVIFQEVEGAGHGLPFEKRPEFVRLLINFLQS